MSHRKVRIDDDDENDGSRGLLVVCSGIAGFALAGSVGRFSLGRTSGSGGIASRRIWMASSGGAGWLRSTRLLSICAIGPPKEDELRDPDRHTRTRNSTRSSCEKIY